MAAERGLYSGVFCKVESLSLTKLAIHSRVHRPVVVFLTDSIDANEYRSDDQASDKKFDLPASFNGREKNEEE